MVIQITAGTFTIGAEASAVRADVVYGGSSATNATLTFTPAPVAEEYKGTDKLLESRKGVRERFLTKVW